MNDIIYKFFLAGYNFMPDIQLRQLCLINLDAQLRELTYLDFHMVHMEHLLKTKKEYKTLKKMEIQNIFVKTN